MQLCDSKSRKQWIDWCKMWPINIWKRVKILFKKKKKSSKYVYRTCEVSAAVNILLKSTAAIKVSKVPFMEVLTLTSC